MRELIEFFCNESDCSGYFHVNLNLGLSGDFLFVCPNCGRQHPRTVKKGDVVGDVIERIYMDGEGKRATRNGHEGRGEKILVPKSAYTKKSILRELEGDKGGFLANLWARAVHGGD